MFVKGSPSPLTVDMILSFNHPLTFVLVFLLPADVFPAAETQCAGFVSLRLCSPHGPLRLDWLQIKL